MLLSLILRVQVNFTLLRRVLHISQATSHMSLSSRSSDPPFLLRTIAIHLFVFTLRQPFQSYHKFISSIFRSCLPTMNSLGIPSMAVMRQRRSRKLTTLLHRFRFFLVFWIFYLFRFYDFCVDLKEIEVRCFFLFLVYCVFKFAL